MRNLAHSAQSQLNLSSSYKQHKSHEYKAKQISHWQSEFIRPFCTCFKRLHSGGFSVRSAMLLLNPLDAWLQTALPATIAIRRVAADWDRLMLFVQLRACST